MARTKSNKRQTAEDEEENNFQKQDRCLESLQDCEEFQTWWGEHGKSIEASYYTVIEPNYPDLCLESWILFMYKN